MSTAEQVQRRRGNATQVAAFTGAQGELAVDTTNNRVVVQDGSTAGGFAAAKLAEAVTTIKATDGAVVSQSAGSGGVTALVGGPGGHVNRFRNATMDVWQRGTSGTVTTSGGYTADGWIVVPTGASVPWAQSSGRLLTKNALQVTGASSVTDVIIKQRIESLMAAAFCSQVVTVQAQVFNGTGGSITPTLTVKRPTAADNYASTTTDVSAVALQACPNSVWTLVAYTFTANASSFNGLEVSFDFGNNFASGAKTLQLAELDIRVTPGATAGAQNSNPPPPELRPAAIEMLHCQRYYWRWNAGSANTGLCMFQALGATSAWGTIANFLTTMRAAPTVGNSGAANFSLRFTTGTACNALDFTGTTSQTLKTDNGWTCATNIGGTPTNGACIFVFANSSSAWIDASAEL